MVLVESDGEGMRRDGGFELLAIHDGLSRNGLGDAPRMKVAFLRAFRKTEVCSAAAASRRERFAQGRPRAGVLKARDGEFLPREAEPARAGLFIFVPDKAALDARSRSEETTQTQTQMDILIVFCTASFIATYAILVYRALPQE